MKQITGKVLQARLNRGRTWKRLRAAAIGLVVAQALSGIGFAHNAGHIFLPDGTCQEMGSFRGAPLVGQDRTQLDLVPQTPNPPRDEYGVSFVGFHGNTPIIPGACPVVPVATTEALTNSDFDPSANQPFNGI